MIPPQTVAVWTAFLGALFSVRHENMRAKGHAWDGFGASPSRGVTCGVPVPPYTDFPCPELAPALALWPLGDKLPHDPLDLVIHFNPDSRFRWGLTGRATCGQDGSPCNITRITMGLPGYDVPVERLSLPLSLVFSALGRWFNHPMKFDQLEKGASVELSFNWDLNNKNVSFLHRESMEGMFVSKGDGVTYRRAYPLIDGTNQGIGPTNYFNSPTYDKWQGELAAERAKYREY